MGRLKVSVAEQQQNRARFKASNKELMQIAAGINHIVIKHDSQWSLMPGMGPTDKIFDVQFSRPVLKRPLTENDKMVAIEWAKYHPRMWRVILTLDMCDGEKWYADHMQIETPEPYKLNDLKPMWTSTGNSWKTKQTQNTYAADAGRQE